MEHKQTGEHKGNGQEKDIWNFDYFKENQQQESDDNKIPEEDSGESSEPEFKDAKSEVDQITPE